MSRAERREEGEPERISELIEPVLRELKRIGQRVGKALHEAWPEVAGPTLARRTRLRAFKAGRLYVEVDSSALLHELTGFRSQELLARLRERVPKPDVSEIRFRLASFAPDAGGEDVVERDG